MCQIRWTTHTHARPRKSRPRRSAPSVHGWSQNAVCESNSRPGRWQQDMHVQPVGRIYMRMNLTASSPSAASKSRRTTLGGTRCEIPDSPYLKVWWSQEYPSPSAMRKSRALPCPKYAKRLAGMTQSGIRPKGSLGWPQFRKGGLNCLHHQPN